MQPQARVRQQLLRQRIQFLAWLIVAGLVISGVTAIPLQAELDQAARMLHAADLKPDQASSGFVKWVLIVREALHETYARFPFFGYGTDWLAFAHIVVAIAFYGAVRHPLRNAWLFTVGMMAGILIIPWALFFGELRGVPVGWRLIDCTFGALGFLPCWLCSRWLRELEQMKIAELAEELS